MANNVFANRLKKQKTKEIETLADNNRSQSVIESNTRATEPSSDINNIGSALTSAQSTQTEMRDRQSILIDIRTLSIEKQIRNRFIDDEQVQAFTDESIQELAASIKSQNNGKVLQNIILLKRENDVLLVAGERRVRACKWLAESENDDSYYFQNGRYITSESVNETRAAQIVENLEREDTDPVALAHEFKSLQTDGLTVRAIAKLTGVSTAKVSRYSNLIDLPKPALEKITSRELPMSGRRLDIYLADLANKDANAKDEKKIIKSKVTPKNIKDKKSTISITESALESVCYLIEKQAIDAGLTLVLPDFQSKASVKKFIEHYATEIFVQS